jgi:hypothetical protein
MNTEFAGGSEVFDGEENHICNEDPTRPTIQLNFSFDHLGGHA